MAKFECVIAPDGGFPSFFLPRTAHFINQIFLFLLFLFFHSFPLSFSLLLLRFLLGESSLSRTHSGRASRICRGENEAGRVASWMREGVAFCTHRLIVRRQETVARYESKAVRAAEKRIRQRRSSSNYTRPPFESEGKTNNFHTRDGPVSILSIFASLELSTRLSPRLKNIWNIKFGILFLLAIPRNSIEKKFDSFSRSDYSRSRIGQLPFPERGKKPRWKMERWNDSRQHYQSRRLSRIVRGVF